jgi:hypothetical protein
VYVRATVPIRAGTSLVESHIRLYDDTGAEVPVAFVDPPLFTPDRRQLTLLFHPGRQKEGIGFGAGHGPILEEGRTYRLAIAATLSDVSGRMLGAEVAKTFTVGPIDRQPPDPARWTVERTGEAVVVHLDEPVDAAMAVRAFAVEAGGSVATTATIRTETERIFMRLGPKCEPKE